MYLNTLNQKFSIINVAETWTTSNNIALINISGYQSVSKNRTGGRGGGVALFQMSLRIQNRMI